MDGIPSRTHHLPDQVSSPAPAATQWKKAVFSRHSGSGEKLAESIGNTLSRVRNNNGRETVKQAASPVLDRPINNWQTGKVSENNKLKINYARNHEIKEAYRNFLMNNPLNEKTEVAVINLNNQIKKLSETALLTKEELQNIAKSMSNIIIFVARGRWNQTPEIKLNRLREDCNNIYLGALKQLPEATASEIRKSHSEALTATELKKGVTKRKDKFDDPDMYLHFIKKFQENVKSVNDYPHDVLIGAAAIAYTKVYENKNINAENILKEFETIRDTFLKSSARPLDATEKDFIKKKVLDSFKEADRLHGQTLANIFENDLRGALENSDNFEHNTIFDAARSTLIELQKNNTLNEDNLVNKFGEKIKDTLHKKSKAKLNEVEISILKYMVRKSFEESKNKIPRNIEEKNITQPASSSKTKPDTVPSEVNNQNLLKEFEIDLRKELNGSHKFQWNPEAIVAIARSTLSRFQSSANFTVANLRLEFNKDIKSTSEYEPEKNLTDFEIMDLGMMMTRSFLNAQIRENSGKTVSTNSNPTQ